LEGGGIFNHFYSTYTVNCLLLVVIQIACAKLQCIYCKMTFYTHFHLAL
jgi:hypothetical protein